MKIITALPRILKKKSGNGREKRNISRVLPTFLSVFCCFLLTTEVGAQEAQTVRVAFMPDVYGFYTLEENGGYSGYNYDFLMSLAQYTGWDLEFVLVTEGSASTSLKKAGEMLEAGELDLVGPFTITEQNLEKYEIGEKSTGTYRYNIYSARDNYAITEYNYFMKDSISIALVEAYEDLNQQFFHLMENRNLDFDIHYVQTHQESLDMLYNEEVDTILNLDMSINTKNLDYVTVVDHLPFYFVAAKGNTELVEEMDQAIGKMEIVSPYFHESLLETYFSVSYEGNFVFTDEEITQLQTQTSFKVGLVRDIPPFQYSDSQGNEVGITPEVLEKLEELLGIPFEIVYFDSLEEHLAAAERHEVDLLGSMSCEYDLAQERHVTLTNSYISSGVYWLRNENDSESQEVFHHYVSSNIPYFQIEDMTRVVEVEEYFLKMEKQGGISLFCNPYVAEYFIQSGRLENIEVQSLSNVKSDVAFGVLDHVDKNLVGMLNRAILYLDHGEIDEIIFRNTTVQREYTMDDVLNDFYLEILVVIFLVASGIIFIVHRSAKKFKELSQRDGLTNLYNAGYFHHYAEEKIPQLSEGTLIILDIDYFKQVNDNHGHQKGDEIIQTVANTLQKHFRNDDVVARLGGDEFVILLEHAIEGDDLEKRCQGILEELATSENQVPVTLSIGGYSFSNTNSYNDLYKKADDELYKVKEKGRNGFLFEKQIKS